MGLFVRTKSIVIVALLCTFMSGGAYGALLYYTYHLKSARGEIAISIEAEHKKDEALRLTSRLLEDLAEEETAITSRFVAADDVVPFIELIEASGKDAGVALEVVSVSIATEKEISHEWLAIALKADGAWQGLVHLIMLLETMPYVVNLDSLSLRYEEKEGEVGNWSGTFSIRAAKLKNEEKARN
jgi:hypothetical protein